MFRTSLNNPPAAEIVETYHDDAGNWYRVYSDGWIEQGGVSPALNINAAKTINFLKPFKNNNYVCLTIGLDWNGYLSSAGASNRGIGNAIGGVSLKTTTTFTIGNNIAVVNWYACGYGV